MSRDIHIKEKNKFLFSILKLIKNRKNEDYMNLVLYGNEGIVSRNINKNVLEKQKKVLICYLTNVQDEQELEKSLHTNIEEKYVITQYFIENNYQIDICNCRNIHTIKRLCNNQYDIIFGFGSAYQWACNQWKDALHIEYFTESPFWYSEKKEKERVEYYKLRTGKKKDLYRTGMFYKKNDEFNADAIICMCEGEHLKDVQAQVFRIYPHGLYNKNFNFGADKQTDSFLFFGTAGYIHKGLDVTIEAFKQLPNLKLYVCGGMEQYILENGDVPNNIIDCGKVNVQSEKFLELVNKCMFVILPSCSEASPSGVLTCMRHGLIPIVSKGLGLDQLNEYGFFLEDYKIDYLKQKIEMISNTKENKLQLLSQKVYLYANKNYSLETFKNNFYSIMKQISCVFKI